MMVSHTKSQFIELSKKYSFVPLYTDISSDIFTPSYVLAVFTNQNYVYLLESVEPDEQIGRFSFVGIGALKILRCSSQKDPLVMVQDAFKDIRIPKQDGAFPFEGGFVGYINYDLISQYEPVSVKANKEYPGSIFVMSRDIISFDNREGRMRITTFVKTHGLNKIELGKVYDKAVKRLNGIIKSIKGKSSGLQHIPYDFLKHKKRLVKSGLKGVKSSFAYKSFEKAIQKARDYIYNGEIIQVVLSQRLELNTKANPFDVYRVLRLLNPSPYMFFLKFGKEDLYAVGASPEVLVKASGRKVETHPIAGTRWRGATVQEDEILAKELLADEKERAEHIMLVDLGRNDLGRVCKSGSVKVKDFMHIQNFSHVMHIVSKVEGSLDKGKTAFDAFRAAFPAGTVSGAPKIRAIQIIDELEPVARGMYAGSIGYFDFSGNMDMCITIRTIVFHKKKAYVQAGAGIVADSQPKKEYRETLNKAAAQVFAIRYAEKLRRK